MRQNKPKLPKSGIYREAKNKKIILDSLQGKTQGEIAKDLGITRKSVHTALNQSPEIYDVAEKIQTELEGMVTQALDTVKDAMVNRADEPANALKAALSVLDRVHIRAIETENKQLEEWMKKIETASPDELSKLMDSAKLVMMKVAEEKYARQVSRTTLGDSTEEPELEPE